MEALQIMVHGKLPKMSKVQWDLLKKTGRNSQSGIRLQNVQTKFWNLFGLPTKQVSPKTSAN